MPTYNYKCEACDYRYSETRSLEDPQFFTICDACKNGNYIEISE